LGPISAFTSELSDAKVSIACLEYNPATNKKFNIIVIANLNAAHFQVRTRQLLYSNALSVALCWPQINDLILAEHANAKDADYLLNFLTEFKMLLL
jgi:hypothetical protein